MSDSEFVFTAGADNFDQRVLEQSHRVPVLVDFWAGWCAPCKMLMPILSKLAEAGGGQWLLAKVDTDAEQSLAQRYGVRSLPTVKLFRNGEAVDEFMGALPESQVQAFLDKHIERASDRLAEQAAALAEQGRLDEALAMMDQALTEDPENSRVLFRRLGLLMSAGRLGDVQQALAALPIALSETPDAQRLKALVRFRTISAEVQDADALAARLGGSPASVDLRQGAALAMGEGDYEQALELLMQLLGKDPGFADKAPKDDLLAAFELVGNPDLVNRYRRRMFNLLH